MTTNNNYVGGLVEINGRPLFMELCGPPEGELFVVMHGLGGSTNTFPIANEIAALGYRVVRWDYEGSGKSPLAGGTEKLSIEGLLADLHAILLHAAEGRPLKNVHIYGHSGGSMIGQYYTSNNPEIVSKLILAAPGLPRWNRPEIRDRTLGYAQLARKVGIHALADRAYERNLGSNPTLLAKLLYRTTHSEGTAECYAQILELLAYLPNPNWDLITCKTLVIAGNDDLATGKEAEQYPGLLKNAEVKLVVLNCGHIPALEVPDEVLAALTRFLAK